MFELPILVLIIIAVVWAMRGGKSSPPQAPIEVHQPGKYYFTLAPQFAHVESYLVDIANRFALTDPPQGDIRGQYYEIRATSDSSQALPYLLAISRRNGTLYFQAIGLPQAGANRSEKLKAIREFSDAVLAQLPLIDPPDDSGAKMLAEAVGFVSGDSKQVATIIEDII